MVKRAKWMASAAVAAGMMGLAVVPAYASVGSTVYGAQTSAISTVNTVLSPTGAQLDSTWIYVTVGNDTIPVDPPRLVYR